MNKKHSLFLTVVFSIVFLFVGCNQTKNPIRPAPKIIADASAEPIAVGFYNLENLFDTINQSNNDEEFLPNGFKKWTGRKYRSKLKKLAYAISQIGKEEQPKGLSVLGVAEVENRGVLEDLVKQKYIAKRGYKIIHFDSSDKRGIDVAMLYNPKDFVPTTTKTYRVKVSSDHPTRDVLMVKGRLLDEEVYFLINHWPSRSGGQKLSEPKRKKAGKVNRKIVKSIYKKNPNAKIIIMGDLNDDPADKSISEVLEAKKNMTELSDNDLYNPFWKIHESGIGTLSYKGKWNLFDQIIVSTPFIYNDNKTSSLLFWKAEVFNKEFLKQQKGRYRGTPRRTNSGRYWLNGYSDHFPTLIYLVKAKQEK